MSISTWLTNGKAKFSVVETNGKKILVCTKNVAANRVIFIEDIETGKRVFPTEPQSVQRGSDLDDIVRKLALEL